MKIRIINNSKHELHSYSTVSSSGMDVRADNDELIMLKLFNRVSVKTGLFVERPVRFEAQIC